MSQPETDEPPTPARARTALAGTQSPPAGPRVDRDRIVAGAIELADADGLGALSMARLADRIGCGTMSLYRHVANKDELVVFMAIGRARATTRSRRSLELA